MDVQSILNQVMKEGGAAAGAAVAAGIIRKEWYYSIYRLPGHVIQALKYGEVVVVQVDEKEFYWMKDFDFSNSGYPSVAAVECLLYEFVNAGGNLSNDEILEVLSDLIEMEA